MASVLCIASSHIILLPNMLEINRNHVQIEFTQIQPIEISSTNINIRYKLIPEKTISY
jgi:hypothetical protein